MTLLHSRCLLLLRRFSLFHSAIRPSVSPLCLSVVTDIATNRSTYSTLNSKELTRYTITSKAISSGTFLHPRTRKETMIHVNCYRQNERDIIFMVNLLQSTRRPRTTPKDPPQLREETKCRVLDTYLPSFFMVSRCALASFTKNNVFADTLLSPRTIVALLPYSLFLNVFSSRVLFWAEDQ